MSEAVLPSNTTVPTEDTRQPAAVAASLQIEDDGLYDVDFLCAFFGGSKPLHPATIYRGIAAGRFPRPVKPSPNVNRWIGRELKASKRKIFDQKREPLPSPRHRS